MRIIVSGGDRYLTSLTAEHGPSVSALLAADEAYFYASGSGSGPADVQSLFYSAPPGRDPADKSLLVLVEAGEVRALVDAFVGYPDAGQCAVGLFLVHPKHRRRGLGTAVARALLSECRSTGITHVTATLPTAWPSGQAFAESLGATVSLRDRCNDHIGNIAAAPGLPEGDLRVDLQVIDVGPSQLD